MQFKLHVCNLFMLKFFQRLKRQLLGYIIIKEKVLNWIELHINFHQNKFMVQLINYFDKSSP